VRRGDHVALFLDNHPDFLWCLWGLGTIDTVVVPLNTAARGDTLRYYLVQPGAAIGRTSEMSGAQNIAPFQSLNHEVRSIRAAHHA